MVVYRPLYISGKRDRARRYVSDTGTIISRREYIKITEGVTPEGKAYKRYKEGKAPKGKTVEKIERSAKKKKVEKAKKERPIVDVVDFDIPSKDMWKTLRAQGRKIRRQNTVQLQGEYAFYLPSKGKRTTSIGYSLHGHKPRNEAEFKIMRAQAVEYAKAQLPFSGWVLTGILWEQWLLW